MMSTVKEILQTMDYGTAPEAKDTVTAWLAKHQPGFRHYIGGAFASPIDGQFFESHNPADGAVIARIGQGTKADVDRAVAAARDAFPAWSKTSGETRAKYLYAIARHVQKRERFLAVLESLDNGKPIRESRDIDVPLVARHF